MNKIKALEIQRAKNKSSETCGSRKPGDVRCPKGGSCSFTFARAADGIEYTCRRCRRQIVVKDTPAQA